MCDADTLIRETGGLLPDLPSQAENVVYLADRPDVSDCPSGAHKRLTLFVGGRAIVASMDQLTVRHVAPDTRPRSGRPAGRGAVQKLTATRTTRRSAPVKARPMLINSIAPWFGSKRTMAPEIVRQLGRHSYYFEACAGSMAVLFAKDPTEHETVCDLHGALTNLAWCAQRDDVAEGLYERLQRVLYDDELYLASKTWLADNERVLIGAQERSADDPDPEWAYHYFIASWMGRNGVAGTARINYQIATRWTKGGGSGPGRFRAAVESIPAWHDRLRNVHVLRRDVFAVLPKLQDDAALAVYADPPYLPETVAGNSRYLCDFSPDDHRRLAEQLRRFRKARVVVSYYASPCLAGLYPGWTVLDCSRHKHLHVQNGRGTGRKEVPEILLVNGPAAEGLGKVRPAAKELFA